MGIMPERFNSTSAPANVEGLRAHPARPAANMPVVQGRCPSCKLRSLFLAVGGHVTCASLICSDPCAADNVLEGELNGSAQDDDRLAELRAAQELLMVNGDQVWVRRMLRDALPMTEPEARATRSTAST